MKIVYQDTDLVIVNKPVGCAAHPSPGWTGPTVVGALVAAGIPLSPSGPAERQGIVQRLDVGTSGLMMVAKTEAAEAEAAFDHQRLLEIGEKLREVSSRRQELENQWLELSERIG